MEESNAHAYDRLIPILENIDHSWLERITQRREFVTLVDADDRLLYVNQAPLEETAYVGQPVFSFIDARFHDELRDAVRATRETGLPQHFDSYAAGKDFDTSKYSNWVVALQGQQGEGLVAFIAIDISNQTRVEAELERSQTTLSSLIENSPDAILITDRDRRILFINRVDVGMDKNLVLGQLAESFVPAADRQKVLDAYRQVLGTAESVSYETNLNSPDDERVYITRVVPISKDGEVDRVMMVATDVTAQKAAEQERARLTRELQQAQKMESIGQLTGGVAHDFNNLLIAISGNLELSQLDDLSAEEKANCIEQALEATRRAGALTERLLAFSRKQNLTPQRVDVNQLVTNMRQLLERTLGETISIDTRTNRDPVETWVDPAQMESALLNLALNARDAMPEGGDLSINVDSADVPTLEQAGIASEGKRYIVLRVRDTGTGMSPEVVAQAVEPFFTTKEVGRGSGLGLSMVYGFVQQSGGHVRILSQPGAGTTVELYLPALQGESKAPAIQSKPAASKSDAHELIMVVEDDALVRSLTARILVHLGYRTLVAEDARKATRLLADNPDIALVLSDVVLPGGMDGFTLARHCEDNYPQLPVLLVSGYPQDTLKPTDQGRWRLLPKPYTTEQLAAGIADALAVPSAGTS